MMKVRNVDVNGWLGGYISSKLNVDVNGWLGDIQVQS